MLHREECAAALQRGPLSALEQNHLELFFVDVLHALGKRLDAELRGGLRQQVTATAVVYFKRFTVKVPWTSIEPYLLALTCIYLAIKVEESGPVSVKTILKVGVHVASQLDPKQCTGHTAAAIKECEFFLVDQLEYCLVVYHPYKPLVDYVNDASLTEVLGDGKAEKTLLRLAWNVVNDSLRSDLSLTYPPYMVALACLHMASSIKDFDISAWFTKLNVDMDEIMEITQVMLNLYGAVKDFEAPTHIPPILSKLAAEVAVINASHRASDGAAALSQGGVGGRP